MSQAPVAARTERSPGQRNARRRLLAACTLVALGGATAARSADAPLAGHVLRIGRLSPLSALADMPMMAAFRKGMRELGWVEGQHYALEAVYADGVERRLPALAAGLVRQKVDLILAGSTPGVLAAKGATHTIPILMVTTGDPLGAGLVASLARPEANVTGLTAQGQGLAAKRIELLKRAVPGLVRATLLSNPSSRYAAGFVRESEEAAAALGLKIDVVEAREAAAIAPAFATMAAQGTEALAVLADPMFITAHRQVVELATRYRIPAIYGEREFVDAGGLMFYGASLTDLYERAARHAERLLRGASPAELPVEQPTRFEMIVSRRVARAMGMTLPAALLLQADRVID